MESAYSTNRSTDDAIVHRILTAVADREGCDTLELPPISEVVDPDSLGRVAESGAVSVTFAYNGYRVSIDGDGRVGVTPA